MKIKEAYKEKISTEIQGLSESEIEKIVKMIHLLKTEFLGGRKKVLINGFKKARGAWKDIDIDDMYKKLSKDWEQWKPLKFV